MFRLPTGLFEFLIFLSQLSKQRVTGLGYWSRLSNTEIEPMVCAKELKRNSRFDTRGSRLYMVHNIALLVFNGVLNLDSSEYTGGTKKLRKSYRTFFITIARSAQETEGLMVTGGWLASMLQILNCIAKVGREISCQCHSFGRQTHYSQGSQQSSIKTQFAQLDSVKKSIIWIKCYRGKLDCFSHMEIRKTMSGVLQILFF